MSCVILYEEKCPRCGKNMLFVEYDYGTQEYLRHCSVCGYYEEFEFRRDANGIVTKSQSIPFDKIALTVRIIHEKRRIRPVVWETALPENVDTDFLYLYLNQQVEELKTRYPQFAFPDMQALKEQHEGVPFCCVEKKISSPSRRDGQSYIRMSYIGNCFDVRHEKGGPAVIWKRAKYKYHSRGGCGVIRITYHDGSPAYWRVFGPHISERRAKRLWAAHTNENTNYEGSYLTLMQNGELQILKGNLSGFTSNGTSRGNGAANLIR